MFFIFSFLLFIFFFFFCKYQKYTSRNKKENQCRSISCIIILLYCIRITDKKKEKPKMDIALKNMAEAYDLRDIVELYRTCKISKKRKTIKSALEKYLIADPDMIERTIMNDAIEYDYPDLEIRHFDFDYSDYHPNNKKYIEQIEMHTYEYRNMNKVPRHCDFLIGVYSAEMPIISYHFHGKIQFRINLIESDICRGRNRLYLLETPLFSECIRFGRINISRADHVFLCAWVNYKFPDLSTEIRLPNFSVHGTCIIRGHLIYLESEAEKYKNVETDIEFDYEREYWPDENEKSLGYRSTSSDSDISDLEFSDSGNSDLEISETDNQVENCVDDDTYCTI